MHRGTHYPRVGFRLICWTGFQFLRNLSTFKIFWCKNVGYNFNCFPLFAVLRYECLPEVSNGRFTRDNETNTDVLTPLYNLKLGVSASFRFIY